MMQKTRFSQALLAFLVFALPMALPAQSLIGKWKGTSEGEVGMMTFDKAGYVTFTTGGQSIGGKEFDAEGITMSMTYETDATTDPHTIDLVMTMGKEKIEVARMPGIYKFEGKKTLIINMNFDGTERPLKFDETDKNQITLHKAK